MNTPAHLIFGLAAFGKPDLPKITAAALAGAMIPDLSLYLLSGWHLLVLGTAPEIVFGELYFSDLWQGIFRIDNSFIVWGVLLGLGLVAKLRWLIALAGAALLHIGLDFPLHHDDGRAHFWPLSNWIFQSPVSYWDRNHYAGIVAPIEIGLALVLCVVIWRRFKGWLIRGLTVALGAMEALPVFVWMFMFG